MQIRINNKPAAIKKGTSFEFVSENRLFTGSDGYTLTITFPLKGCPQNIAIFGHVNRADVIAQKVIFDCEIRYRGFYKFGSITITEINESEVKTQFLEGRSEQNFDQTFDKVYINELELGTPKITAASSILPWQAWDPITQGYESVALPWVNNSSDSGIIHNCAEFADNAYTWSEGTTYLSWQPYMLYITKRICEAVGYTPDFTKWEEAEEYKYLLICNCLSPAWYIDEYARALPHWTVDEYFEKLELFLGGEFNIDHRSKRISFDFSKNILATIEPVHIDSIIDEHSIEVKVEDEQCEYIEAKNLVYKECDHRMWKYYSCDWYIKSQRNLIKEYDTLTELLDENKGYASTERIGGRGSNSNYVLHAKDLDMYFCVRPVSRVLNYVDSFGNNRYLYKCVLQPLNLFGGRIVDDSVDAEQTEIEFVPAGIDYTEDKYGNVLFLNMSGYSESSSSGTRDSYDKDAFASTVVQQALEAGESEKKSEYYDCIYVGYWDGAIGTWGKLPHPYVDNIVILDDWSNYYQPHFSLRINDSLTPRSKKVYNINPKQKTTFKFLADTIPDVRALFIIRGKRYICEKITATFTENGMSRLLKGVFYKVIN